MRDTPNPYYSARGTHIHIHNMPGAHIRTHVIYKLFHVGCFIIANELPKYFAFVSNHVTDRSAILF